MNAPTGEWKSILAGVLFALSVSGWFLIYIKRYGKCLMPLYSFKSLLFFLFYYLAHPGLPVIDVAF